MAKNIHAVRLGELGGKARAKALTAEERQSIARMGGLASAESGVSLPEGASRKGGLAGGKARAAALSPERRKEIARAAGIASAAARKAKNKTRAHT